MAARKMTKSVMCGNIKIGGMAPISIQSMTNTDTKNVMATVEQIARLKDAGCDIVRCAVPDMESAAAIGKIKKAMDLPLVADIHFDYRLALLSIKNGADKIRINPGNIGDKDHINAVLNAARERGIPIRVGVNSGSLEKDLLAKFGGVTAEALAESAVRAVTRIEDMGFTDLVVSVKASRVKMNYDTLVLVKDRLDYPFHIGITESGTIKGGKIKSAVGIGALLLSGIGDTIRVSLTGDPVLEVLLAKDILEAAEIRAAGIQLISCPTCGRTKVDLEIIAKEVEERTMFLSNVRSREGKKPITVAIMGCEVNGPGEAREADIGVACGRVQSIIFQKGLPPVSCASQDIAHLLLERIQKLD